VKTVEQKVKGQENLLQKAEKLHGRVETLEKTGKRDTVPAADGDRCSSIEYGTTVRCRSRYTPRGLLRSKGGSKYGFSGFITTNKQTKERVLILHSGDQSHGSGRSVIGVSIRRGEGNFVLELAIA